MSQPSPQRPSPDSMAFFREHGYMVVENLVSPAACDRAIAGSRRLEEAALPEPPVAMQPHLRDPFYFELLCYAPILSRIESIIGPPVVGLATHLYYAAPGCSGLMRHQDNFCVEAPTELFASCWVPLVDVDDINGCLRVYPGTHRAGMLPVRPLKEDEIRDTFRNMREETVIPGEAPGINLHARRGTGIFLHGALVHESLRNRSTNFRYAFLGSYMRKGSSFRPGNTARRYAIDVAPKEAL